MGRRRWRRRRPITGKTVRRMLALAVLAALLGSCIHGYREILELVAVYGENRCRNLVTQYVLDAAAEVQTSGKLSSFTESGERSVIALDSTVVRDYQAAVGKRLTEKLDALVEQNHSVPIGTVFGGVLLMGRGPQVELRFMPVGSARVTVGSQLQEAGVNQVLYRVVLELAVDMTVILPGGAREIRCDQQVVLEEVLLTGQVPMVYAE